MQDLTKPPHGSKYRLLSPEQFGFGRVETKTTVIVDWTLETGKHAQFSPIRVSRKEIRKKYGVFENYSWADTPMPSSD
jgi:hypothetical protein